MCIRDRCDPVLPPPETCNKCSVAVHHICQIDWENKHSYEPPGCSKYCPSHHQYYRELTSAGGGKLSSQTPSLSGKSSEAVATAAATVAQKLYYPSTPGCEGKAPPLFEVSDKIGVNTSPADSTLTPAMTHLPPTVGGTSDVGFLKGFDHDAYDNALADGVIDDIIFDDNHGDKLAGNVVISTDDMDDLDEEGEEEQGGDSDGEGDEADLHNIALARRLINDDLGEQCYSKST